MSNVGVMYHGRGEGGVTRRTWGTTPTRGVWVLLRHTTLTAGLFPIGLSCLLLLPARLTPDCWEMGPQAHSFSGSALLTSNML